MAAMGQVAEWSHETVLAGECASASRARDFVCLHLVEHGLLYLVEDVRLVVSELATNALGHAHTSFLVRLEQTDQLVLLTVQDGSSAVPRQSRPDVMNSAGRGLQIVGLLSRDWGVTSGPGCGKAIWAAFAARRAAVLVGRVSPRGRRTTVVTRPGPGHQIAPLAIAAPDDPVLFPVLCSEESS